MTVFSSEISARRLLGLTMLGGLLHILVYFLVGWGHSDGAVFPISQPDSLLYFQSARQIARGMAFEYTPGSGVSTGSTTHLYPFILAIPYALGATGDALPLAGFLINALFYLGFIGCWVLAVFKLVPSSLGRVFACLMLVLSGQSAYTAASQSDMGLFMLVSSGMLAAVLYNRWTLFGFLLALAPWCRPEGVPMALLFVLVAFASRLIVKLTIPCRAWICGGVGAASAAGVFVFNHWLTGDWQFQSVLNKGFFNKFDLLPALLAAGVEAVKVMRELLLGLSSDAPRDFFYLPLLGSVAAFIGICTRPWKRDWAWKEIWWLAANATALMIVATSGWQGTNYDRYLGWVFPIWLVFIGQGVEWCFLKAKTPVAKGLFPGAVLSYQATGAIILVCAFASTSTEGLVLYDSLKSLLRCIPADASIGGFGGVSTIAYCQGVVNESSQARVDNFSGIYSPRYLAQSPVCNLERLKHDSSMRFKYWYFPDPSLKVWDVDLTGFCPDTTGVTLAGMSLRLVDWGLLDRALEPRLPDNGWQMVDQLDVGYPEDEVRCDYYHFSRVNRARIAPLAVLRGDSTNGVFEVGRAVIGYDEMTVAAKREEPLRIVMRTIEKASVSAIIGLRQILREVEMSSPSQFRLHVDGQEVGVFNVSIESPEAGFAEIELIVPGHFINRDTPRITLYGDHIALAYWFYQPKGNRSSGIKESTGVHDE